MNYCSHLKVESIFCSICKLKEETILHLFYECIKAQILLLQLYSLCNDSFSFPVLTPRNEIFEYIIQNELSINHLLLFLKCIHTAQGKPEF